MSLPEWSHASQELETLQPVLPSAFQFSQTPKESSPAFDVTSVREPSPRSQPESLREASSYPHTQAQFQVSSQLPSCQSSPHQSPSHQPPSQQATDENMRLFNLFGSMASAPAPTSTSKSATINTSPVDLNATTTQPPSAMSNVSANTTKKRAKKTAPAAANGRTNPRPSRARKAPARLVQEQPQIKKATSGVKKTGSLVFDPAYMTSNPKSRLVRADIYHLLLEPGAWDSLSASSQQTLLAMIPQSAANIRLQAKVTAGEEVAVRPKQLQGCDILRTDVAKFQEDLDRGYLAKGWQVSAAQAMVDRKAGVFDEWKEREMEAWWGQKLGC